MRRLIAVLLVGLLLGRSPATRLRLLLRLAERAETRPEVVEDQAHGRVGAGGGGDGVRALARNDDASLGQGGLELDDLVAALDRPGRTLEQPVRGTSHCGSALLSDRGGD